MSTLVWTHYENDFTQGNFSDGGNAFNPALWAQESLAILEENMVVAMLCHRDFEPIVAQFGDVVNTRRPGQFVSKRKTDADQVTIQDATAVNVQVPLNQWLHVSFMIKDGQESKSFKDLVSEFMAPAMLAQARIVDQILLGQAIQFMNNNAGGLGQLSSTTARSYILNTRNVMNKNKAYVQNRNLILTPNSETAVLGLDLFLAAQQVGDDGTALREASLGRKLGFDIFMCQNAMSVPTGNSVTTGAVNNASGYPAGYSKSSNIAVDLITGAVTTGTWLTIAGDNTPYRVAAHTETLGNTTAIKLDRNLQYPIVDDAVITFYTPGAVNFASGYPVGYAKEITVDNFTVAPVIGQPVTFGNGGEPADLYTIVGVNGLTGITLDRPLEFAISDDDAVNIGPAGDYNFAFHRNAFALVCRPLAQPRPGTGALSAVVNYNDLSMRATITYQGKDQGHLVTLDMLLGVAILDQNLGAVLLG